MSAFKKAVTAISLMGVFGFAGVVHADDTVKDTTKVKKVKKQKAMGGSETVTETDAKHDEAGMKNDSKTHSTHTVEKDAAGNVTTDKTTK